MVTSDRCDFVYSAVESGFCCYRKEWNGTGRCIWHAKAENDGVKADEERGALREEVSATDGAGVTLDGANFALEDFPDGIDLAGFSLRNAEFSDASLQGADLRNTDLRNADLSEGNLEGADLRNADLRGTILTDATLQEADLRNADLRDADLADADLRNAGIRNADLQDSRFLDADLRGADLVGTNCWDVNFRDARLTNADFEGATLNAADFTNAILRGADLEAADLEGAFLNQADLYDVDFTDARFYGAILRSARANEGTNFDRRCIYDPRRDDEITEGPDEGPDLLTRAIGAYHQLEQLCSNNSLLTAQSRYFVHRQDIHTIRHRREGRIGRWLRARFSRAILLYGESPFRVVGAAIAIILTSTFLYPLGYLRDGGTGEVMTYPSPAHEMEFAKTIVDSFYFSTLSFMSMTYGQFVPTGPGKFISMFEMSSGVMLVALLIFVYGRRATR